MSNPVHIKSFPGQAVETFRKHHDGRLPNEVTLTERRAEFVYDAARLAAIHAGAPIIPAVWKEREQGIREQFLEVIERQSGDERSKLPEELTGSRVAGY